MFRVPPIVGIIDEFLIFLIVVGIIVYLCYAMIRRRREAGVSREDEQQLIERMLEQMERTEKRLENLEAILQDKLKEK